MSDIKFIETIIPSIGRRRIKFYGFDSEIYNLYSENNEFCRQKQIKHLGIITKINDGANHTRFDYLALQCALVDILGDLSKGTPLTTGSIKVKKRKINGNSLLKSWILFSNFGHCFNTIADEKSLLLYALENKDFRRHLINTIKDNDLKKWTKQVIDEFDYSNFHYIISLYRIYKHQYYKHNTENIINPLKILLLDNNNELVKNINKLKQLKHIHKTIRMLSIISLDSQYSHIPFTTNILSSIASLPSWEKFHTNQYFVQHLKPFYNLLINEIYLDKRVMTNQKKYQIEAKNRIMKIEKNIDIEYLIKHSLDEGLVNLSDFIDEYEHFIRVPLFDTSKSIISYNRELEREFKDIEKADFIVESHLETKSIFVDFILEKDIESIEFAKYYNKICRFILNQIEFLIDNNVNDFKNTIPKFSRIIETEKQKQSYKEILHEIVAEKVLKESHEKLVPIYEKLFWSTINYFIKDKHIFDIVPTSFKYDTFGISHSIFNSLQKNLKVALEVEKDVDRLNELKQIQKSFKYSRKRKSALTLGCLSRIDLYDLDESPDKAKTTDIDGVLIHSLKDELIIEFHESKNTNNPYNSAKKDIKKKLVRTLNDRKKGYRIKEVKGYGAKLVIKSS